jgi:hypothetical protein
MRANVTAGKEEPNDLWRREIIDVRTFNEETT